MSRCTEAGKHMQDSHLLFCWPHRRAALILLVSREAEEARTRASQLQQCVDKLQAVGKEKTDATAVRADRQQAAAALKALEEQLKEAQARKVGGGAEVGVCCRDHLKEACAGELKLMEGMLCFL